MAYNPARLLVWAYHSTHTLWRYDTDDDFDDLRAAGYFNAAADVLRHGDVIQVTSYALPDFPVFRFFGVATPKCLAQPAVILVPVQ